ncbi:MAG: hypothetical protein JNJ83_00785 [Verrucomicrobiaceae bacterium]|nr:hypothetical protein [Verrucomicrobiaceae bacterium]
MPSSKPSASPTEKPPVPSKGVKLARANRSLCNEQGSEEREALMSRAMNLIYGGNGQQVPARRR